MKSYIPNYKGPVGLFSVAKSFQEIDTIIALNLNVVLIENDCSTILPHNYIIKFNIDKSNELCYRDVIEINYKGMVRSVYQYNSNSNAIVTGMSCNSNCIMCPCSEQSRKNKKSIPIEYLKQIIDYIPDDAPHITITGGEPTLLQNDFIELVKHLNIKLPNTYVLYLTNGRAFINNEYAIQFNQLLNHRNRVAVPIHGHISSIHDNITQAPNSLVQTIKGIQNLERSKAELEIRIVVSKLNYQYLSNIADLIINSFNRLTTINFIGLEMTGNAIKNADKIWVNFECISNELQSAVEKIIKARFDVKIYNFPLCKIDRNLWLLCERSISDYKVVYKDECGECSIKSLCGGFFMSTNKYSNTKVTPIGSI